MANPPLAKAEPISNSGSSSGIMYLRRKIRPCNSIQRRGMRIQEGKNSADTQVGGEGQTEVPLQPLVQTVVRQLCQLQPWRTLHGATGCLKKAVIPWETHAGAGSCQDPWSCRERSPCWSWFLVGFVTLTPWGTHAGGGCA